MIVDGKTKITGENSYNWVERASLLLGVEQSRGLSRKYHTKKGDKNNTFEAIYISVGNLSTTECPFLSQEEKR